MAERQFWSENIEGSGNLGSDPKLITKDGAGTPIAVVSVAARSRITDRSGNLVDRTVWRNLKFFGYQADAAMDNLEKGMAIIYKGRLAPTEYENNEGEIVQSTEVLVDRFGIVPFKNSSDKENSRSRNSEAPRRRSRNEEPEDSLEVDFEEDLNGLEDEAPRSRSRSRSRSRGGSSRSASSNEGASRSRSRSRSRNIEVDDDIDDYEGDSLIG